MARQKLTIDKAKFQEVVTLLESQQEFKNPSELWKAVENSNWAKTLEPRSLTSQVAYMRARELGIIYKTQPGKRGPHLMTEEQLSRMREGRGKRRPRSEKMMVFAATFKEMRKTYPSALLPLIARAEKGGLRAAITLKCLECSAFQRGEVRQCQVTDCSLFPHRPSGSVLTDITETETEETEVAEGVTA